MAACELSAYLGVKASVDLPQIHFIRRPSMETDDAICVLSLIPEAQAHFSFVTLLEAETCFLFWNEFLAIKLEMTKGQYFQLRRHLLWRKYMFVTPAGMVAMLEDLDAAVYVPFVNFQAKYALKIIDPS